MLPWGVELAGRLDRDTITSDLLVDNPLVLMGWRPPATDEMLVVAVGRGRRSFPCS
jgi:hypothetical protein